MSTAAPPWLPEVPRLLWGSATLAVAAVGVQYGLIGAHMLLRTRRLVGPGWNDAREAVRAVLHVSRGYGMLVWSHTVLLYLGLGALWVAVLSRDWPWLVAAATPFTLLWWVRIRTTLPPGVLLLGTSTPTTNSRQRDLKRRIHPLRVISLLDAGAGWDAGLTRELSLDCFRTTVDDDWWLVTTRLMDVVPVIVIDSGADTCGVAREAGHILRTGLAGKCLFLTAPDGYAPMLDRLLPETGLERRDLHLATYHAAPDAVAAMVAALSRP